MMKGGGGGIRVAVAKFRFLFKPPKVYANVILNFYPLKKKFSYSFLENIINLSESGTVIINY